MRKEKKMNKDLPNKIYIAATLSWSYEGGDCLNCMYSSFDKSEVCKKCLEYVIKSMEMDFETFVELYSEYKIISISDSTAFTSSHMINEVKNAKTVAEIMGLDKALHEAVEKREHTSYCVEKDDPEDVLLQKQIINYLKKVKGEENE